MEGVNPGAWWLRFLAPLRSCSSYSSNKSFKMSYLTEGESVHLAEVALNGRISGNPFVLKRFGSQVSMLLAAGIEGGRMQYSMTAWRIAGSPLTVWMACYLRNESKKTCPEEVGEPAWINALTGIMKRMLAKVAVRRFR